MAGMEVTGRASSPDMVALRGDVLQSIGVAAPSQGAHDSEQGHGGIETLHAYKNEGTTVVSTPAVSTSEADRTKNAPENEGTTLVSNSEAEKVLTSEQKAMLIKQRREFLRQSSILNEAVNVHLTLTGRNVLEDEKPGAAAVEMAEVGREVALAAASGAGAVAPDTTPAAKSTRLSPEAEQILLSFFSLQDTLTKEAASVLAQQAGCDESQARDYFTKMRSYVRSVLQRMHRRSTGHDGHANGKAGTVDTIPSVTGGKDVSADMTPGLVKAAPDVLASPEDGNAPRAAQFRPQESGDGAVPELAKSSEAMHLKREAREEKLRNLLDAEGGIAKPESVAPLLQLMSTERSWNVREQQLAAVLATKRPATVAKLCGLPNFLPLLMTWLLSAEVDSQTTFLKKLLHALGRLPVQGPSLAQTGLPKAVGRLQKYRSQRIADAASILLQQWQCSTGPGAAQTLVQIAGSPVGEGVEHALAQPVAPEAMEDDALEDANGGPARPARAQVNPLASAAPLLRGTAAPGRDKADGSTSLAAAQAAGFTRGHIPRQGAAGNHSLKPLTADEIVRGKKRPGSNANFLDFSAPKTLRTAGGRGVPSLVPSQAKQFLRQQKSLLPAKELSFAEKMEAARKERDKERVKLEAARRARQAAEAAMVELSRPLAERMVATYRGPWVLHDIPPVAPGSQPARGEDSLERVAMAARDAMVPPFQPVAGSLPISPGEPPDPPAAVQNPVPRVPFSPLDPRECESQLQKLIDAGVLLPEYVKMPYRQG